MGKPKAFFVDDVDHRRKGRGFTRADRAGDQHKTVVIVEQALDVGHVMVEKTEFLERTDMPAAPAYSKYSLFRWARIL